MKPCQHLDYESEYIACELKDCAPHYPEVKYWKRNNVPYEGAPVNVQFCKKIARVNGIFQCYNGEMYCYEPKIDKSTESDVVETEIVEDLDF